FTRALVRTATFAPDRDDDPDRPRRPDRVPDRPVRPDRPAVRSGAPSLRPDARTFRRDLSEAGASRAGILRDLAAAPANRGRAHRRQRPARDARARPG